MMTSFHGDQAKVRLQLQDRPFRLVVAMANNRTIGRNNTLPWRLSEDLRRFKRLTMGHALIMGRKTYDSIGKLLPGRETIILTRQSGFVVPGALMAHSVEQVLQHLPADKIPFVVGGAEIYRLCWPYASEVYLTRVLADIDGDAHLDAWDWNGWGLRERLEFPADEKNEYPTAYEHWVRTES